MKNYGCDEMHLDLSKIDFQFTVFGNKNDSNVSIVFGSDNSIFNLSISKSNARELSDCIREYFLGD